MEPNTKSLELTPNQAQALIDLLNVATKAGGLDTAKNALFFADSLQSLFVQKADPGKNTKKETKEDKK
tara:strand:- start:32 stop:235 length:204 start_codon:yes stop_codon:yes gene_type:complete